MVSMFTEGTAKEGRPQLGEMPDDESVQAEPDDHRASARGRGCGQRDVRQHSRLTDAVT